MQISKYNRQTDIGRRRQGLGPGREATGSRRAPLLVAVLLALALAFVSARAPAPALRGSVQPVVGEITVTVQDNSGTKTYRAPCVFPSPKNGTVTVSTDCPEAQYQAEISVGRHRVSGVVTPWSPVTYYTDGRGNLIQ